MPSCCRPSPSCSPTTSSGPYCSKQMPGCPAFHSGDLNTMTRFNTETVVGLFLLAGIAAFAYLTIALGGVDVLDDQSYTVKARFTSVSGLKEGSPVEIAGVPVGKVQA